MVENGVGFRQRPAVVEDQDRDLAVRVDGQELRGSGLPFMNLELVVLERNAALRQQEPYLVAVAG